MRHHAVSISLGLLAAVGLGALVLIPGAEHPNSVAADEARAQTVTAGPASPNPALLRAIDSSLQPPLPAAQVQVADVPARVAVAPQPAIDTITAPEAAPTAGLRGDRIGSSAVNLRQGPSSSSATVSVLAAGQPVQVGETSKGWVQVTLDDGTIGWVYSRYLAGPAAAAPAASDPQPNASAPARVASTRAKAVPRAVIRGADDDSLEDRTALIANAMPAFSSPDGDDSFMLKAGQRVRIAEVRGNWLRVETANGTSAWIKR